MIGWSVPPRAGDLAAVILSEALQDGDAFLLTPGRPPEAGRVMVGWSAGEDVFLPTACPSLDSLGFNDEHQWTFEQSYAALLAEGANVRIVVPDFSRALRFRRRSLVRLLSERLGVRASFATTAAEFALAARTISALQEVQTHLGRLRGDGIGPRPRGVTFAARQLAPYVALAQSLKRRRS